MKNIIFILGTRPEIIKLAPLVMELKKDNYNVIVCNTEQQKELSNQTLAFFEIKPDISLNVMSHNQTLGNLQSNLLSKLNDIFLNNKFDAAIVQGDTMSAFCGALSAFYNKVPVFHVEGGLRSFCLSEPFPEEAIRQMISRISELHFVPTALSKKHLLQENVEEKKIFVTGNTVVDALNCIPDAVQKIAEKN